MPDVFLGEFGIDVEPPFISNRSPANLATGVLRNTDISFDVKDVGGSGVSLSSLDVVVDGANAILAGVFQPGFSGTITPIVDGYAVVINPNTDFPFSYLVSVSVDATDIGPVPNVMTTDSWSFTSLDDNIAPVINNLFPADLSINIPLGSFVSFDIVDLDSPVPQSTINLTLNGADAILGGIAQPGFAASFVPILGGFSVSVNPATDFALNLLVTAVASGTDSALVPNLASASWSFTTIVDNTAPVVTNNAPTGTLVSRAAHIRFDLTDPGIHGVDLPSVVVIVNGQNAYASGVSQTGTLRSSHPSQAASTSTSQLPLTGLWVSR